MTMVQADDASASSIEQSSSRRAAFKNACGVIKSVATKQGNTCEDGEATVSPAARSNDLQAKYYFEPKKSGRGRPRKRRYLSPDTERSEKKREYLLQPLKTHRPIKRRKFYFNIKSRPPLNIDALNKAAEDLLSLDYAYQSTYTVVPTTPTK